MVKINDVSNKAAGAENVNLNQKANLLKEASSWLKQTVQLQDQTNKAVDESLIKKLTDDKNTDQQKKKAQAEDTVRQNSSVLEKIMSLLRKQHVSREANEAAVATQQAEGTPQYKEERDTRKDLEAKYGKMSKTEMQDMLDNRFTLKTPKSFG